MKLRASKKSGYNGAGFTINHENLLCPVCSRPVISAEWFPKPKYNPIIRTWCNCGLGTPTHFDCEIDTQPSKCMTIARMVVNEFKKSGSSRPIDLLSQYNYRVDYPYGKNSVDPSMIVTFDDGSTAMVANPYCAVFRGWIDFAKHIDGSWA